MLFEGAENKFRTDWRKKKLYFASIEKKSRVTRRHQTKRHGKFVLRCLLAEDAISLS